MPSSTHVAGSRQNTQVAFKVYDVDGDGKVSRKDLRKILTLVAGDRLKDVMLDDVVTAVIDEHDKDGDGCLSYGTRADPMRTAARCHSKLSSRLIRCANLI